jgi:hypothetical protein
MAKMLRPEKIHGQWLTAPVRHSDNRQVIDCCTGKPFETDEDIDQEEQHCIITCQHLRVNRFMLMDKLAQYWLLDVFSRICDQRLSIIEQMRDCIMMGQPWQKRKRYSANEDIKEEEWRGAGYIDEPRKESYLPDSVHRPRGHMAALAKNTLMSVLEFGCPHVFLTLTYNPEWPEISNS